jgi:hypothetical protein
VRINGSKSFSNKSLQGNQGGGYLALFDALFACVTTKFETTHPVLVPSLPRTVDLFQQHISPAAAQPAEMVDVEHGLVGCERR